MTHINVFGSALAEVMPDIGVITISVGTRSHTNPEAAQDAFAIALPAVRGVVKPGADSYVEKGMRSWSTQQTNEGVIRHSVCADVIAKYTGKRLETIGEYIKHIATIDNVSVNTSWEVSPALMKASMDKLLAEAVRDAKRQVQAIADAAGVHLVKPVLFAEPELFPDSHQGDIRFGGPMMARGVAGGAVGGFDKVRVDLQPEPLDISARIAVSYLVE